MRASSWYNEREDRYGLELFISVWIGSIWAVALSDKNMLIGIISGVVSGLVVFLVSEWWKQHSKHIRLSGLTRPKEPFSEADFYFRILNDEGYPITVKFYWATTKKLENGTFKNANGTSDIEIESHKDKLLPIQFDTPLTKEDKLDTIDVVYARGDIRYYVYKERLYRYRIIRWLAETNDKVTLNY